MRRDAARTDGWARALAILVSLTAVTSLLVGSMAHAATGPSRDYRSARWVPASPHNYRPASRPRSSPIRRVVIHVTELSYADAIAWFRNPAKRVSAHYVIRSSDGAVTQMVRERDIAWHAGNGLYNATSIGIEHEAWEGDCSWYTEAMYRSSARLVAHIARRYGIPIDRRHIIGHSEVPDPLHPGRFGGADHHVDPGPCWDWKRYLALVRGYARPHARRSAG